MAKTKSAASVMLSAIQEFSAEDVQRQLVDAHNHGVLENKLHELWSQYVPFVYSSRADVDVAREDRKARRMLFRPLETFICNGDPDTSFRQLKERDNPPQLCGKVFKMGELTYSCRDCGTDPTCVLCMDCFQHSAHKKHRYKMAASGGGGYCDCGDREAWKAEPFCDVHKRGLNRQQQVSPVDNLPPDLKERAEKIFMITVQCAVTLLTWKEYDSPPKHLRQEHLSDSYITVLFNDEVHTYEQVISTLQRAVGCTQKEAIELATITDREGRAMVKRGSFDECEKARVIIEKQTTRQNSRPLVTHVMHTSVVAQQTFAMRILSWLNGIIKHSDGLRQLFCQLLLAPGPDNSISFVEKILLADTQLWKAARVLCHQFFMAGVLMDPDSKRQFSVIFTQLYQRIASDFVSDDHSRKESVSSVSVQIFTVSTLARMLIAEHNLLQVTMDAFLVICQTKINKHGKFAFERQDRNAQQFKRACYMLCDFKYALAAKPSQEEWSDQLRMNFMNGFRAFVQVLRAMEGMDAVTRQTSQHIEFEPEWEQGFNLHLRLADCIALVIEWCSSDPSVLVESFNVLIEVIHAIHGKEEVHMTRETTHHYTQSVVKYDVASQPVYIHLPITRLFAGLLPFLSKLNLNLQELIQKSNAKLNVLIEPSLRAQVLAAQVHAQMWRRNGYSLLNQIYFYHNVRCRTEMFDKDITLLQSAAANMDPNEFMLQVILRFGLMKWAKADSEQSSNSEESRRQLTILAEKFLNLLIIIIGERFVPGVGRVNAEDMLKREVIHQLCIKPMAHSELTKALPEDPDRDTGIEEVVKQVATFKKPTGTSGKGMYELKEECFERYNPFFYHYTRAERSKSEETQRNRKKLKGLNIALPPPCPPDFCDAFRGILRLLNCSLMHFVIALVLKRAQAKYLRCWSETQFEKILHLISLALYEEKKTQDRLEEGAQNFTEIDADRTRSGETSIYSLLKALVGHPNITPGAQNGLLTWVIEQYDSVREFYKAAVPMETSTPVSTHLDEQVEKERKRKAEMANKRREQVMARMKKMQKNFIHENSKLFESTNTELPNAGAASDMDVREDADAVPGFPTAVGPKRSASSANNTHRETCILCQEEQEILHDGRAMVLAALVQKSTVLSKSRGESIKDPDNHDPLFMSSTLITGAHTSTCGHVMHADCWQGYFDAVLVRERRQAMRFRHHISYNVNKMEFLCPLCQSLSNTVIPLIPHVSTLLKSSHKTEVEMCLNDWLDGIQKTVRNSIQETKDKESEEEYFLFVPCPLTLVMKTMSQSAAKNFQALFDYVYDDASAHFSDSVTNMLRKFSTDVYSIGLGVHPDDENERVPVMAWSTCAYTIMTIEHNSYAEQCLRQEEKPLFGTLSSRQADCLSSLVKFAAVSSQVITSDIIRKHCVTLLSAVVCESADKRLRETPCILNMDLFHHLVALCLSLPTLYSEEESSHMMTRIPSAGLNDLHLLKLTFAGHLVQVILTADLEVEENGMDVSMDEEATKVLEIFLRLRQLAGIQPSGLTPSAHLVQAHIKNASLPFLRCTALFFHYLSGVTPPEALLIEQCGEEFELLCQYLSLPCIISTHFNQGEILTHLVDSWCTDEVTKQKLEASASCSLTGVIKYPIEINGLMPLPQDYSELITKVSTFTCPKSEGDDSRAPTMCLVCGTMLCSQSYCCQTEMDDTTVGAATAHAHSCGAGTGIFLRVRECQVLLMSGRTKGCFFAPPYLDDYGETDQGLRRGNPLHLCAERYESLQRCWLYHNIPEKVAHVLESNANLMSIEWQHL